jgi:serine/threonine-protein kinase RsbW
MLIMAEEEKKIRITSQSENIALVEKLVNAICETYNIGEDHYGNILVAITEAVNNAIQHGNKANPNKNIDIGYLSDKDHLRFSVKDEGDGFNYDQLPDPTNPENIEKPNGRGVFLMKHLADHVEFEDNGSKVVLDFKLSAN